MKSIGERVQSLRLQRDMSSTELARTVGISQAQISRLECGKQGWRSSTIERVAKALGVTVSFLYADDDSVEAAAAMLERTPKLKAVLVSPIMCDLTLQLARLKMIKSSAFRAVKTLVEQLS